MMTDRFPSDPSSRRAIVVLSQYDVEKCRYEPGAQKLLLDEEVHVLQLPVLHQECLPTALQNIVHAGLARPGMLLVQSPYDSETYEDAEHAAERYAVTKHMYFSAFCRLLGARAVSVEQIDLRTRTKTGSLEVHGKHAVVDGEASATLEELNRLRSQLSLNDEFSGSEPDVQAAEIFLQNHGLWADLSMRNLLDMRRGSDNALRERKLSLSLSSEAKSNLKVIGRLTVPSFIKLSADCERIVQEQHEYTLLVSVTF